MKTSFKKLTCLFLSILMIMSVMTVASVSAAEVTGTATGADKVYVDVSGISNNYSYFAWVWNDTDSGSWRTMAKNGSYYEVQVNAGDNILFAAMPAGTTSADWSSSQGQTGDTTYDGINNFCTLTLGGNDGLMYNWTTYANGTVGTTAKPNTLPAPSTATTAPPEPEETVPTHPKEKDENEYLYVIANSNLDPLGIKVKTLSENEDLIIVTYTLTADKIIDGGQAVISYDSLKLDFLTKYNNVSTMFPNLSGVICNMTSGFGEIKFNFSGLNNDFTQGDVFVNLVFARKYKSVGTATVGLDITDLTSKETTYIEDGVVNTTEGYSLVPAVSEGEAVQATENVTVETDATTDITINASSNIDETVTEIKADKATVKVTYNLTADQFIAYGNGSVEFDENVLALEDKYNNVGSIFTTVSSGASYNLNAATGMMKFAFNGIDSANKKGLFNFTEGRALVTLVFTVKSGATGSTNVKLNLEELGAYNKEYVVDSEVNAEMTVSVEGVAEEATTADPTDAVIATGESTGVHYTEETEAPVIEVANDTLKVGQQTTVTVKNVEEGDVTFKSSNTKVATVSAKGVVKAVGKGTVTITATIKGFGDLTCTIKVTAAPAISVGKKTLYVGEQTTVTVNNASSSDVTYKSSNTKVATVSAKGVVKAVGKGTAKITAKVKNYGDLTCTITVNAKPSIKAGKNKLNAGQQTTVTVNNAGKNKVTYKSSNPKVATVSTKGVVKALGKGIAKITATVKGYGKLTCKITVKTSPKLYNGKKAIKKNKTYTVKKGKTLTLTIKGKASGVNNSYKTGNKKIAKVTSKNNATKIKIKGYKKGTAKITVTVNKNYKTTFKVKVK